MGVALLARALSGVHLTHSSDRADAATTFVVNKTGDAPDRRISDNVCDASRERGKQCTLRAAIEEANDTPNAGGPDLIRFSIGGTAPVKTISPSSPLPVITDPVTINGYTQPGAKPNTVANGDNAVLKVQINESNAGAKEQGFRIRAADSTIKGLVINRFILGAIEMSGTGVTDNRVAGNFIETTADGSGDLGDVGGGVLIGGAPNNTIGGTDADDGADDGVVKAANLISGNRFDGVLIFGTGATGNSVLSNRIFANGELGIDLVGNEVTGNDTDDIDTGANNLQNFPVITSVTQSSTFLNPTRVSGTLNSTPNQDFTVQCFLAGEVPEDADASGRGQGRTFVAEDVAVRTDSGGNASFECNFSFPVSLEGKRWSATATNEATGDTSEFSTNFPVE